jgi:hypothetical protein
MKLMAGKKMSHWIKHPKPSREQHFYKILHHVIDVCEAVSYAHSKGILHLDIKPGNIHIGDFGETYLFDWGIAKVLDPGDDEFLNLTLETDSEARGTPGCMSPEQIEGSDHLLSSQTDIFLIGGLLYSLYSGQRLTEGFQESSDSQVSDLGHYPLSTKDIYGENIPASLLQIIKKATHLKPELRYQTVNEIKLDLDRYLNHYPTSVDRHKTLKLVSAKISQHPYLSLGSISLILLSLIFANYLSQLQLKHTKKLSQEQEKTIQKIMPFANMPARNILGLYAHPKAMEMAQTLIETKPEASQAWMLKGLLEASRFDFKAADRSFNHILELDMIVSHQNGSVIRLTNNIKKILDHNIKDLGEVDTILYYIKTLNEGRFNSLLSRNFYNANRHDLDQCLSFFDKGLKTLNGNRVEYTTYSKKEEGLEIILKGDDGKLNTSTFFGMPYHSLILKNFDQLHLPMLQSPTLKKLDLSGTSIDHIYFLPDLNLEWLNISNLHIHSPLYEGMPFLKTFLLDNLSFENDYNIENLINLCRNIENLSVIGIEPKTIFKSLEKLKHLKRLRCSSEQKKVLLNKLKSKPSFEFVSENQPL